MKGIESRVLAQDGIKIPVIVFGHVDLQTQRALLAWAVQQNWYFDIVQPEHIKSLSMRVANILRIHDHLHEIARMMRHMSDLQDRVTEVESLLSGLTIAGTGET